MQTAVITGISGLVGSQLAKALLQKGISIIGIDKSLSKFTEPLEKYSTFSFKIADVSSIESLRQSIPESFDIIYHFAGQPSVWFANSHPREDFTVNCSGTVNVLEILRERGGGKIIFASTGDIYGDTSPATEDSIPEPNNFYGLSKLTAENYVRQYSKLHGIKFCNLRFSLIYGPQQNRNVVFDILQGLKRGEISLFTNLDSEYDLIYLDDAVTALDLASSSQWENETVNISNNYGISTRKIIDTLLSQIVPRNGIPVKIVEQKTANKILSNKKALQLGWKPTYTFEEGIKNVFQWWMAEK
jgi:UDP-glucose 4-epimerase